MYRHQLLGLLRDGRSHHGYALVKEYMRRAGVETNTGYTYRDLQKMVEEGLVELAANDCGADKRRRPYRITDAGRRCFDEWFTRIPSLQPGGDGELAARAIFFEEVDRETVLDLLDRWGRELRGLSEQLRRQIDRPRRSEDGAILRAIRRRRLRAAAMELSFVDDLRAACPPEAVEEAVAVQCSA